MKRFLTKHFTISYRLTRDTTIKNTKALPYNFAYILSGRLHPGAIRWYFDLKGMNSIGHYGRFNILINGKLVRISRCAAAAKCKGYRATSQSKYYGLRLCAKISIEQNYTTRMRILLCTTDRFFFHKHIRRASLHLVANGSKLRICIRKFQKGAAVCIVVALNLYVQITPFAVNLKMFEPVRSVRRITVGSIVDAYPGA